MKNYQDVTTPIETIMNRIFIVRGQRVILDATLAELYGVSTKRLNEQVGRNQERFPGDFCFVLTWQEVTNLKSQSATSSLTWGGTRKRPRVFTEYGVLMAANVLNSPQAVRVSLSVVRAFVKFCEMGGEIPATGNETW